MSELRLYRDFYKVTYDSVSDTNTNTLINPYFLSASTNVSGSTTVIESFITPTNEITGRYYIELDLTEYSYDIVNEATWCVQYLESSPIKTLKTRFKINPKILIGSDIMIEILPNNIDIEIN